MKLIRRTRAARKRSRMATLRREIADLDSLTTRLDPDHPEQHHTLRRAQEKKLAKLAELTRLERT